ncbi:MAG: DHH family phosphoesterase [Anaerolineales bacterium]|nr:DHH family phosphoesterase [Anaerolineales bacterium]
MLSLDPDLLRRVAGELRDAWRILVISHIRPDGDAVGSLLGMGLALQHAGKDVQMVLSDGIPSNFRHLEGSNQVRKRADGTFDYIIVLDISDLKRCGSALNGYGTPDLNIDHHFTNLNFARHNLVLPEAVATAEVLALMMGELDLEITPGVANALLTGLVTDTIGFRTPNMHSDVLRLAAQLMDAGGDLTSVYYPALVQRSFVGARYWGVGLSKLKQENGVVWTTLTLADRLEIGYPGRDDADLINVLSSIEGAEVAIIFVEQSKNRVKISWRRSGMASEDVDVSQVALCFGGGGHKAAAGAEVDGNLNDIQDRVLEATRAIFTSKHGEK